MNSLWSFVLQLFQGRRDAPKFELLGVEMTQLQLLPLPFLNRLLMPTMRALRAGKAPRVAGQEVAYAWRFAICANASPPGLFDAESIALKRAAASPRADCSTYSELRAMASRYAVICRLTTSKS